MRIPYIAGNWKMHKTRAEARSLAETLVRDLADVGHTVMVAPPFTAIETVAAVVSGTNILVGAQNASSALEGAHTGEVSPLMLKDLGVSVVILGHSERRHTYGETDQLINAKVATALGESLNVILCVGETLEEREAGRVDDVVRTQLEGGLAGVDRSALQRIVIAYEPVWAIGTGKTATPQDADAVHGAIRTRIAAMYDERAADELIIQYGGSVKPGNVRDLMAMENIDGALVGGASLKAETFVPIVKFNA